MALLPHALTSLLAVKTSLGYPVPADPHDDDTFLESLINAVTVRAEAFCNRILKARSAPIVEFIHGKGRREFLLKQWPVGTVAEVAIGSDADGFTALDPSEYFVVEDSNGVAIGLERRGCNWEKGRRNIRVTYPGGYATVPADLEMAAQQWVAFYKRRFEDKDLGLKVRSKGDENITIENTLPPLIREILMAYKRSEFEMDDPTPGY